MSSSSTIVEIDGSLLEGGGQILRNSSALSCLLTKAVQISKIRAGRVKPGLRPQHMHGLKLVSEIGQSLLTGAEIGSGEVTLKPSTIQAGSYTADTHTAGSICLLIQSALPCMLFANGDSCVTLKGGTNCEMAPQIDYTAEIFKPILERMGASFHLDIIKRGYFPKGGGEVCIQCSPIRNLLPLVLTERGELQAIVGRVWVAGVLPIKVAHRMADAAKGILRKQFPGVSLKLEVVKEADQSAFGTGIGLILIGETTAGCRIAASGLGRKGVPAERVGQEAAERLMLNLEHEGCVDEYLQDQVIIFMALADGKSRVRCGEITLHTRTAIHVAEQLTQAKFTIEELGKGTNVIICQGHGLINRFCS